MGDMGDLFNDWRDIKRQKCADRKAQAAEKLEDVKAKVEYLAIDASGTWNIRTGPHRIQYYPTKGTWQYRNKILPGGILAFISWLDNL